MDWTEVLAAEAANQRARLASELMASAAYSSTAARVRAFVEQGGRVQGDVLQPPRQARGWEPKRKSRLVVIDFLPAKERSWPAL